MHAGLNTQIKMINLCEEKKKFKKTIQTIWCFQTKKETETIHFTVLS